MVYDNTYAVALKRELAEARGLRTIGDLAQAPDLTLVFSHEFMERLDGWPGLAERYGLPQQPTGIEHALAYQAIEEGRLTSPMPTQRTGSWCATGC